ncbi:hypothetical protein AAFF_G00212110 [Aldrovandia affinis]|uniref:Uncharacterized protein n=1 Tax=Aldrovandia affinis TaxID=143900 RepID=A0AAD7QZY5_9TELE|nr:hypothetical protein AAFF_G00212110 [Aldrovandia affinis]
MLSVLRTEDLPSGDLLHGGSDEAPGRETKSGSGLLVCRLARQGRAERSSGLAITAAQVGEGQATPEESSGQVSSLQAHLPAGPGHQAVGRHHQATVHSSLRQSPHPGWTDVRQGLQQETLLGRKGEVLEEAAGSVDPPEPWSEVHRDTVPVDLSLTPSVTQGR